MPSVPKQDGKNINTIANYLLIRTLRNRPGTAIALGPSWLTWLCFARGVWWGCVFHHHSFGAHVLRARTRETPGGWYWWLPVTAPPICLCFRFFRTSLSFGFPSALRPPQGYDERVYLECFQQSAPTVLLQNSCC